MRADREVRNELRSIAQQQVKSPVTFGTVTDTDGLATLVALDDGSTTIVVMEGAVIGSRITLIRNGDELMPIAAGGAGAGIFARNIIYIDSSVYPFSRYDEIDVDFAAFYFIQPAFPGPPSTLPKGLWHGNLTFRGEIFIDWSRVGDPYPDGIRPDPLYESPPNIGSGYMDIKDHVEWPYILGPGWGLAGGNTGVVAIPNHTLDPSYSVDDILGYQMADEATGFWLNATQEDIAAFGLELADDPFAVVPLMSGVAWLPSIPSAAVVKGWLSLGVHYIAPLDLTSVSLLAPYPSTPSPPPGWTGPPGDPRGEPGPPPSIYAGYIGDMATLGEVTGVLTYTVEDPLIVAWTLDGVDLEPLIITGTFDMSNPDDVMVLTDLLITQLTDLGVVLVTDGWGAYAAALVSPTEGLSSMIDVVATGPLADAMVDAINALVGVPGTEPPPPPPPGAARWGASVVDFEGAEGVFALESAAGFEMECARLFGGDPNSLTTTARALQERDGTVGGLQSLSQNCTVFTSCKFTEDDASELVMIAWAEELEALAAPAAAVWNTETVAAMDPEMDRTDRPYTAAEWRAKFVQWSAIMRTYAPSVTIAVNMTGGLFNDRIGNYSSIPDASWDMWTIDFYWMQSGFVFGDVADFHAWMVANHPDKRAGIGEFGAERGVLQVTILNDMVDLIASFSSPIIELRPYWDAATVDADFRLLPDSHGDEYGAATHPVGGSAPGPTSGVTATAGSLNGTLTWTAPGDGGSAILSYTITPYIAAVAQTPIVVDVGDLDPGPSYTVPGLDDATEYQFTVFATNAIGDGAASALYPLDGFWYRPDKIPPEESGAGLSDGSFPPAGVDVESRVWDAREFTWEKDDLTTVVKFRSEDHTGSGWQTWVGGLITSDEDPVTTPWEADIDEDHRIVFDGDNTAGTFKLVMFGETTAAITFSTDEATLGANMLAAINALAAVDPGDIDLIDDGTRAWLIRHQGPYARATHTLTAVTDSTLDGAVDVSLDQMGMPNVFHWHSHYGFSSDCPGQAVVGSEFDNCGDAVSMGVSTWYVGGSKFTRVHDDALQNDNNQAGRMEFCLVDGTHSFFSCQDASTDGTANIVYIENCLIRLEAMFNSYKPWKYGNNQHGGFFKGFTLATAPQLVIRNCIFRADQPAAYGGPSGAPTSLCLPETVIDVEDVLLINTGTWDAGSLSDWLSKATGVRTGDSSDWDYHVGLWHPKYVPDLDAP